MSYLQQRAESTTNTCSTQNHIKLRYYLSGTGTLQQSVPAGTAVNNQQDRRRASDGGRATEGERCNTMCTASSSILPAAIGYIFFRTTCISILVLLCTTNTSGGGRAKVSERRRACLLYTSPSPRDRQKSRMPSSA